MTASHVDLAHVGIRLSGQPQHREAKQREEDSIAHTAPCLTNPNQGNRGADHQADQLPIAAQQQHRAVSGAMDRDAVVWAHTTREMFSACQ